MDFNVYSTLLTTKPYASYSTSVADLLSAPLPPRTPEQVEAAFPGFDGAIFAVLLTIV